MDKTDQRLSLTEEIQDEAELYNHLMHIASYKYAAEIVSGKKVLDYGCGSGYGSFILSQNAAHVTSVDLDNEAIKKAAESYKAANLRFTSINQLTNMQFDLIVNFQVIEHVHDVDDYLKKLKSMLAPGGKILISTPDSKNRLFRYIQQPWNIYHIKEYTADTFLALLTRYFSEVEILKIGSENEIVEKEIERTRKLRVITLPCTLFFYPYNVRKILLHAIASLHTLYSSIRNRKKFRDITSVSPVQPTRELSYQDITIAKELKRSTDLLAVCS